MQSIIKSIIFSLLFLSACAPRPYSFFVSDIYTSKNDDKKVVYELREKETLYELIVKDTIGKYKINDTILIKKRELF